MSDDEKQRFSARVKTETLDKIEEYRAENGIDNRSAAIEHMVDHYDEKQQTATWWDTVAEQALFAATLSLIAVVLSGISVPLAILFAGFPSPLSIVTVALLFAAVATASAAGLGHKYARDRAAQVVSNGVEA
jgi:hypothetical protein